MTDAEIIADVLRREGVYDNDPLDPGGETAYGISKRYHPDAWTDGPPTREEAIAIYQRDYAAPFKDRPDALRAQVIDIAVNCGVSAARLMLASARAQSQRPVTTQLVIERLRYYARKVKETPTKVRFLGGWIARATEFL
jgi:lysozyme family protein